MRAYFWGIFIFEKGVCVCVGVNVIITTLGKGYYIPFFKIPISHRIHWKYIK